MSLKPPSQLLDMLKEGSCGLFIGAGISVPSPSSLPGWGTLLDNMVQQGVNAGKLDIKEVKELKKCIKNNLFLEVAEYLVDKIQGQYREYLISVFDKADLQPNDNHRYIAKIKTPIIVTTNYDRLLETCMNNPLVCSASPTILQKIHKPGDRSKLLKIHGNITEPEELILSEKDYMRLMSREDIGLVMKSYFHRYSFVFLGCSLTDPDILMFLKNLNNIFIGSTSIHYALVKKDSYNTIQAQYYKKTYNIILVPFDDYPDVTQFLESVVELQKSLITYDVTINQSLVDSIHDLNMLEYYVHDLEYIHELNLDSFSDIDYERPTKALIKQILSDYLEVKEFNERLSDQLNRASYSDFPWEIYLDYTNKVEKCIELLNSEKVLNKSVRVEFTALDEDIIDNSDKLIKLLDLYLKISRIRINMNMKINVEEQLILEEYEMQYKTIYSQLI